MKVLTFISKRGQIVNSSLEKATEQQETFDFDAMAYKMYEALKPEAPFREFSQGMKEEFEHEDITGGDLTMTAKIVLAHLKEDPQYYSKLSDAMKKGGPGSGRRPEGGRKEDTPEGIAGAAGKIKDIAEGREGVRSLMPQLRDSKDELIHPHELRDTLNNLDGATNVETEGDSAIRVDFENGGSAWFRAGAGADRVVEGDAGEFNSQLKDIAGKNGFKYELGKMFKGGPGSGRHPEGKNKELGEAGYKARQAAREVGDKITDEYKEECKRYDLDPSDRQNYHEWVEEKYPEHRDKIGVEETVMRNITGVK